MWVCLGVGLLGCVGGCLLGVGGVVWLVGVW